MNKMRYNAKERIGLCERQTQMGMVMEGFARQHQAQSCFNETLA